MTTLVVVAPLFYVGAFVVFFYATLDVRDGLWVGPIVDHLATVEPDLRGLLGARSKLVWSGLAVLYVLIMLATAAVSLRVLARRAGPHRTSVVVASAALAAALAVAGWVLGADQFGGCAADPCGPGCAVTSSGVPFSIVPYMGGIFCGLYEASFIAFFRGFFAVALPLHSPVLLLFFAALLSLVIGPRPAGQWTVGALKQGVADFLVILVLGSAILTLGVLTELTAWGWLVEIAEGWAQVGKLRALQVGSSLYWGLCNSALMLLVFAPIGLLLARQARALARRHNEGASTAALESWEREQGIALTGRAGWTRIVAVLAPLLTGALAFLFEGAVGGG